MDLRQRIGQWKTNRLIEELFTDEDRLVARMIKKKDYGQVDKDRIKAFLDDYTGYRTKQTEALRLQYEGE